MNTRFTRGRAGVWAGVVGVLALAGCGQTPPKVAQAPPDSKPDITTPATTPAVVSDANPPTPPSGTAPFIPGFSPAPGTPPTGGTTKPAFVPPTSPTFTPPESLPGAQLPGTPPAPPPMPPAPQPPAPQPPAPQPPDPTKPANPPTGTLQPETPQPTTPMEPKYPTSVGGKDLKGWLKELEYGGGGPTQRDDQVRETAVKAIPAFGPDARDPAVKPLINAIREDPDPGVVIAAITVVSNMGFEMRKEVRPVIEVLRNKLATSTSGNVVRMYCVRSLASFGPDAAGAIPSFKSACLDPSWETRREIAIAMSLIGATPTDDKGKPKKDHGPDMQAINTLLDYQMQDKSVVVRLEAAKSLLALGPPFAKTPQEFIKDTEKPRETMDKVLKFESGKGGKTNARGGTPDRGVYVWTLLLQLMYDDRKITDNLKELAKLVKEPDGPKADEVRLFAIQAIGAAGTLVGKQEKAVSEKVIGAVIDALKYDHEPVLQYTAMTTLALLGKDAGAAVPALEKLIAKGPKDPPEGSPKGTPKDDSAQRMAKQTIEVIVGKRKIEDFGKEDPKPGEKKDDVKAAPPK